jgi:ADP-ribose pyrophosphatase
MSKNSRPTEISPFTRIDHQTGFEGHHVKVSVDTFRYEDGQTAKREIVEMGDVVVVCAYDEHGVWVVSQPREAAGLGKSVEVVAGGVDERDEGDVLVAAKRELSEEIGKGARTWVKDSAFYSSPGILDERMHLFFATDLYDDTSGHQDEGERITATHVFWHEISEFLHYCQDAKTIIALTKLQLLRLQERYSSTAAGAP